MNIKKVRISPHFNIDFSLTTQQHAHGIFADKDTEVNQIINAHIDAIKSQLNDVVERSPKKVL